jgi:hypothetical protein
MLRASLRSRPAQSVGTPWFDPPPLSPKIVEIERYRHKARVVRPGKAVDPTGPELKKLTLRGIESFAKSLEEQDLQKFKLRVLNQYVRCVLGKDGLESYLLGAVKRKQHVTGRHIKMTRQGISIMFERFWLDQLNLLVVQVRTFVKLAARTDDVTRRGYRILKGVGLRGRAVFVTLHEEQRVVAGIYSGTQWNRKRAFHTARAVSHQQAVQHRRTKALLRPR